MESVQCSGLDLPVFRLVIKVEGLEIVSGYERKSSNSVGEALLITKKISTQFTQTERVIYTLAVAIPGFENLHIVSGNQLANEKTIGFEVMEPNSRSFVAFDKSPGYDGHQSFIITSGQGVILYLYETCYNSDSQLCTKMIGQTPVINFSEDIFRKNKTLVIPNLMFKSAPLSDYYPRMPSAQAKIAVFRMNVCQISPRLIFDSCKWTDGDDNDNQNPHQQFRQLYETSEGEIGGIPGSVFHPFVEKSQRTSSSAGGGENLRHEQIKHGSNRGIVIPFHSHTKVSFIGLPDAYLENTKPGKEGGDCIFEDPRLPPNSSSCGESIENEEGITDDDEDKTIPKENNDIVSTMEMNALRLHQTVEDNLKVFGFTRYLHTPLYTHGYPYAEFLQDFIRTTFPVSEWFSSMTQVYPQYCIPKDSSFLGTERVWRLFDSALKRRPEIDSFELWYTITEIALSIGCKHPLGVKSESEYQSIYVTDTSSYSLSGGESKLGKAGKLRRSQFPYKHMLPNDIANLTGNDCILFLEERIRSLKGLPSDTLVGDRRNGPEKLGYNIGKAYEIQFGNDSFVADVLTVGLRKLRKFFAENAMPHGFHLLFTLCLQILPDVLTVINNALPYLSDKEDIRDLSGIGDKDVRESFYNSETYLVSPSESEKRNKKKKTKTKQTKSGGESQSGRDQSNGEEPEKVIIGKREKPTPQPSTNESVTQKKQKKPGNLMHTNTHDLTLLNYESRTFLRYHKVLPILQKLKEIMPSLTEILEIDDELKLTINDDENVVPIHSGGYKNLGGSLSKEDILSHLLFLLSVPVVSNENGPVMKSAQQATWDAGIDYNFVNTNDRPDINKRLDQVSSYPDDNVRTSEVQTNSGMFSALTNIYSLFRRDDNNDDESSSSSSSSASDKPTRRVLVRKQQDHKKKIKSVTINETQRHIMGKDDRSASSSSSSFTSSGITTEEMAHRRRFHDHPNKKFKIHPNRQMEVVNSMIGTVERVMPPPMSFGQDCEDSATYSVYLKSIIQKEYYHTDEKECSLVIRQLGRMFELFNCCLYGMGCLTGRNTTTNWASPQVDRNRMFHAVTFLVPRVTFSDWCARGKTNAQTPSIFVPSENLSSSSSSTSIKKSVKYPDVSAPREWELTLYNLPLLLAEGTVRENCIRTLPSQVIEANNSWSISTESGKYKRLDLEELGKEFVHERYPLSPIPPSVALTNEFLNLRKHIEMDIEKLIMLAIMSSARQSVLRNLANQKGMTMELAEKEILEDGNGIWSSLISRYANRVVFPTQEFPLPIPMRPDENVSPPYDATTTNTSNADNAGIERKKRNFRNESSSSVNTSNTTRLSQTSQPLYEYVSPFYKYATSLECNDLFECTDKSSTGVSCCLHPTSWPYEDWVVEDCFGVETRYHLSPSQSFFICASTAAVKAASERVISYEKEMQEVNVQRENTNAPILVLPTHPYGVDFSSMLLQTEKAAIYSHPSFSTPQANIALAASMRQLNLTWPVLAPFPIFNMVNQDEVGHLPPFIDAFIKEIMQVPILETILKKGEKLEKQTYGTYEHEMRFPKKFIYEQLQVLDSDLRDPTMRRFVVDTLIKVAQIPYPSTWKRSSTFYKHNNNNSSSGGEQFSWNDGEEMGTKYRTSGTQFSTSSSSTSAGKRNLFTGLVIRCGYLGDNRFYPTPAIMASWVERGKLPQTDTNLSKASQAAYEELSTRLTQPTPLYSLSMTFFIDPPHSDTV